MDPIIQPYVELTDFGHISKILSWSIDNKFILALCERWRPETHTFWFPTGECTVTLEDVYMLLGPPIKGKAVNGKTNYANSICMELLETDLLDDNARGQGILLSRLKSYYNSLYLDEHSTEDARIIKTRCYIMLLIGSFLFPEGSGSSMHIMYLPLLRHVDRIGSYSWGSACLAYLYSSLCKNSHKDTSTFSGCAVLLQAWGWSRLPSLAPVNNNPFTFPYAQKWSARGMSYNRCPRHCITQYHNLLDHLRPTDFIWHPYLNLDHDHEVNAEDAVVWTACTPIIRFTTVEMHNSDRVKLQFGMLQNIPYPSASLGEWHLRKVNNQRNFNPWQSFARSECRKWKHRHDHVLTGAVMPTEEKISRTYMAWYRSTDFHFIAEDMYLYDPRQMTYTPDTSTSNPQQQCQTGYTQPPIRQTFRLTNTQTYNQNIPYTQPKYQEHTPYHQQQIDHQLETQQRFAPTPSPYQSRLSQNIQRSFNTNRPFSYRSQEAQTSQNQNIQQPYLYQTPQQPFQPFLDASFTPMSPFNRPGRPSMSQPHPNFSSMGHELSYGGTPSMHTEDYAELSDYLNRPSPVVGSDAPGPLDDQTPVPNRQRGLGSRVRVARGCETGGRLGDPGHHH
ncbi:protein MAIN-LIKE 2-like [Lathyrus oleraceus]|uniref:protein MAIN-LIKE 2-like n=1 Tax=Pisum sativum TaxID=3888 RepID=UPI0021D038AA|nr:protein MAIN-LIKE 2-like [Pisum sativum]